MALGGWGIDTMTVRSTGSMYIYIMVLFTLICQGARVLCSWSSYKKANAAPSLISVRLLLGSTEEHRLNNMLTELLHLDHRGPRFLPDKRGNVLYPFAEALFATYLVWHDTYVAENGIHCDEVTYIFKTVEKYFPSKDFPDSPTRLINDWSKLVRNDWEVKSVHSTQDLLPQEFQNQISILTNGLIRNNDTMLQLMATNNELVRGNNNNAKLIIDLQKEVRLLGALFSAQINSKSISHVSIGNDTINNSTDNKKGDLANGSTSGTNDCNCTDISNASNLGLRTLDTSGAFVFSSLGEAYLVHLFEEYMKFGALTSNLSESALKKLNAAMFRLLRVVGETDSKENKSYESRLILKDSKLVAEYKRLKSSKPDISSSKLTEWKENVRTLSNCVVQVVYDKIIGPINIANK